MPAVPTTAANQHELGRAGPDQVDQLEPGQGDHRQAHRQPARPRFEVRLKPTEVEGGRMSGMTHSWDGRIESTEAGVNVFTDVESLQGWLQMGQGLGGVFLYSTTDVWAITMYSDSPARAKSVQLANRLGRALYDDWQGTIRTVAA
jgi:hypothetical protein